MKEELVRLSKLMSQRGICSRREADAYIEKGWVLVNGEPVNQLGTKVPANAKIELHKEAKIVQKEKVTIILNKPVGYVSMSTDKNYPLAISLITKKNQDKKQKEQKFKSSHLKKLAVAGRLDIESKGLLIFTQDGTLAKKIIGENSNVEKEYLVRIEGEVTQKKIQLLQHSLKLDNKPLKPAKIKQINENQLQFILKEGKKRQIRRMCELVNLKAFELKRVRVGNIKLGGLKEGKWRYLTSYTI